MQIGAYQVVRELARGGQGAVFHARREDGRDVALKLLLHGKGATRVQQGRFRREVEALKRLRHPHVVGILDVGAHQGAPYLVMDFVPGRTLEDRLREGPLPEARALELARKLAEALQHAHERNVLHRDVKPENVILDARGEPWLTDFGLTRDVDPSLSGTQLSQEGRFMGSPGFLAPEQARGELGALSPRTDVFGLGATLYAMLTARAPFAAETLLELLVRMESPPEPLRAIRPDVSPATERLCARCLAHEPDERPRSAGDLAWELGRVLAGEPPSGAPARRGGRWLLGLVAALALAVAVGLAAWLARGPSPYEQAYALVVRDQQAEAALPLVEQLARERPDDPRVLALQALTYTLVRLDRDDPRGGREAVAALLDRALATDPDCALAWYGRAWTAIGAADQGLEAIERAIALDPAEPAYYGFRGRLWLGQGFEHYDRALADYDRALALDPSLARVVEHRASVLVWTERYDEGIAAFTRLIELRPDDFEAWGQRAGTKMRKGDFRGAVDDYSQALRMNPDYALGRIGRASMLEELEDYEAAIADYEHLMEHDEGDYDDVVAKLRALAAR